MINARIRMREVIRRYGMRRNSVAFAIGLNMAEVERRRSYAITQVTCDTGDVLPARGGQRGALRNDAAHMSASLGGHSKRRSWSKASLGTHTPPNDLASGRCPACKLPWTIGTEGHGHSLTFSVSPDWKRVCACDSTGHSTPGRALST